MTERVDHILPDGIYLDLPEDKYHSLRRLSASGIQDMLVSPATYWARSWMAPQDEEPEEKLHHIIGHAYHTARLEPELFDRRFVRELRKEDMPEGALLTDAQVQAALGELGETKVQKGELAADRAKRLRAAGYTGTIYSLELEAWEAARGDRKAVPAKAWDEIKRDAERLRAMPEIAEMLSGGIAEVSILWTTDAGVSMKARIDYLRGDRFVDLKTFDNSRRKHLEACIQDAFRFNRYYVQAAVYTEAIEQIRLGVVGPVDAIPDEAAEILAQLRRRDAPARCFYIWQEKGGVPNILSREVLLWRPDYSLEIADAGAEPAQAEAFKRKYASWSGLYQKAAAEIEWAQKRWIEYREIFGSSPWFPMHAMGTIGDEDYHPNWLASDF